MADISKLTKQEFARMLEHTIILRPEASNQVFIDALEDVRKYNFGAFYVPATKIPLVVSYLGDYCRENAIEIGCGNSGTGVSMSNSLTEDKIREAKQVLKSGGTAVDMIISLPAVKAGDYEYAKREIKAVADLCHDNGAVMKAILEAGYLTEEEIRVMTRLSIEAGADYVKTTVGNGPVGKTNLYQVSYIMDELNKANSKTKLKATNGLIENVYMFIQAGAARIGSNNAIKAVESLPYFQKRLFNV